MHNECPDTFRFLAELVATADADLDYGLDSKEEDSVYGYHLEAQYSAPWSIIMIARYQGQIFAKTAYNPITLFRITYRIDELQIVTHDLWDGAGTAISCVEYSAILYENEQKSRARIADEDIGEDLEIEVYPSYLGLALEELFSKFLNDMLSRPAGLTAGKWISFCIFCALSITKSILIDACALQDGYKGYVPNEGVEANRTSSAYKALIDLFSWASPCDYPLEDWSKEWKDPPSSEPELQDLYRQVQKMVHLDEWEARGTKFSNDFLLSLGSGFSEEGLYNGFFIQLHGLDENTKRRVLSLDSRVPGTQGSGTSMRSRNRSHSVSLDHHSSQSLLS